MYDSGGVSQRQQAASGRQQAARSGKPSSSGESLEVVGIPTQSITAPTQLSHTSNSAGFRATAECNASPRSTQRSASARSVTALTEKGEPCSEVPLSDTARGRARGHSAM